MVALGCRRPARAVRQYQKYRECQGRRLVPKYGSAIRTEICMRQHTFVCVWVSYTTTQYIFGYCYDIG